MPIQGLSRKQVKSQLEALAGLREILIDHGVRCLIVEPIRLTVAPRWWTVDYQAPYMEVRDGEGLRATVSVVERMGRRSRFSVIRPGDDPAELSDIQDTKAVAERILSRATDGEHGAH